jgi:hypothetical protein
MEICGDQKSSSKVVATLATTSLKKCCAKALNRTAVEKFHDILEQVVEEFGIKPENTWNMNEKGVQLDIGAKVAAIVNCDQALSTLSRMEIVS